MPCGWHRPSAANRAYHGSGMPAFLAKRVSDRGIYRGRAKMLCGWHRPSAANRAYHGSGMPAFLAKCVSDRGVYCRCTGSAGRAGDAAHSFPAHRGRGRRRRIDVHTCLSLAEHREGGPFVRKSEGFVFLSWAESLPFLYRTCFSVLIDGAGMPCGWRRPSTASRAYRGSGDASNARRKGWKFARYFPCGLAMARGEERLCEVQRRTLAVGSPRRREKNVFPQCISLPGDTTCRGGRERTPCKAVSSGGCAR